jgi:hypothetical protein
MAKIQDNCPSCDAPVTLLVGGIFSKSLKAPRYCGSCGFRVHSVCPKCSSKLLRLHRFCPQCGEALVPGKATQERHAARDLPTFRQTAKERRNSPDRSGRDSVGRTDLFFAAEKGDIEEVRRIIFSLTGTGVCCQRLSAIAKKDSSGLTAADVAEQAGHKEIADLLRGEQVRMEYYE